MPNEVAKDRQIAHNMFYEAAKGLLLELGDEHIFEGDEEDMPEDLLIIEDTFADVGARYHQGVGQYMDDYQMSLLAAIAICDAIDVGAAKVEFIEGESLRLDYRNAQN